MHEVIRLWKAKYVQKIVHGEKSHQFNDSDLTLQYIFHQIIYILFFYKLKKNPIFSYFEIATIIWIMDLYLW